MSAIRFDITDHVATDNPTRCNALDRRDVVDLRRALDKVVLATSGVRVVVLSGALSRRRGLIGRSTGAA